METFMTKITKDSSSDFCIIQSKRNSNDFELNILEFSNDTKIINGEWTGQLPEEELKNSSYELEMSFDNYLNEIESVFCTTITDTDTMNLFSYQIKNDKFILQKNEKYKCVYAEIQLQSKSNLKDQIILNCINLMNTQNKKLKEYELKFNSLNIDYQTTLQSFKESIEQKTQIEKILLTKFATILNTKKDKIAELEELLLEKKQNLTIDEEKTVNENDNLINEQDFIYSQVTQKLPRREKLIDQQNPGTSSETEAAKLPKRVPIPTIMNATTNIEENLEKSTSPENHDFDHDTEEMLIL